MALSYYRGHLTHAMPVVGRMMDWMEEVEGSGALSRDENARTTLRKSREVLRVVCNSIRKRFEAFDSRLTVQWTRLDIDQFNDMRELMEAHHHSLAEVLCGLAVKVYEWEDKFPNGGGSPQARADFVMTQIRPGLDRILVSERQAPKL